MGGGANYYYISFLERTNRIMYWSNKNTSLTIENSSFLLVIFHFEAFFSKKKKKWWILVFIFDQTNTDRKREHVLLFSESYYFSVTMFFFFFTFLFLFLSFIFVSHYFYLTHVKWNEVILFFCVVLNVYIVHFILSFFSFFCYYFLKLMIQITKK